jgi:hypothetical protein
MKTLIAAQQGEIARLKASTLIYEASIQALRIRIGKMQRQKFDQNRKRLSARLSSSNWHSRTSKWQWRQQTPQSSRRMPKRNLKRLPRAPQGTGRGRHTPGNALCLTAAMIVPIAVAHCALLGGCVPDPRLHRRKAPGEVSLDLSRKTAARDDDACSQVNDTGKSWGIG